VASEPRADDSAENQDLWETALVMRTGKQTLNTVIRNPFPWSVVFL